MMKTRTRLLLSASLLAGLIASPALAQTASPTPQADPAVEEDASELDEIVVTGIRRSLQSAQRIKQNSDSIVDVVVAEDIGKLPDVNVSDSLARITGVQIERGGGEGGRVLIRGLPDLTTTYNGRDIFTAEARFVAPQDFPAGGVAALEVYKSTTPDLIEGGIAGLINVRSRRPFDFDGFELSGSVNGLYATQSEQNDYNGNLLVTNRWDTGAGEVGALLNLSYTRLRYLDSVRFNGGFIDDIRPDQVVATPQFAGARFPDGIGIFYGSGDRERPSVNAALQWRPNDDLMLYADVLYQGFHNQVSDRQLFVPLFGGSQFTNIVLQPGTNQVQSMTVANAVRPELFQGGTENQTDTYQFAVGGEWSRGPLTLTVDLARTDSKYDSSIYSFDTAFTSNPSFNVDFDVDREDGGVEFDFINFDTENPANFRYRGFFDRHLVAEGEDWQFRTDGVWDIGDTGITQVKFGYRFSDRDASFRNGERYSYQEFLNLSIADLGLDPQVIPAGFQGSDVQQMRTWVSPTYDSIRDNITGLRQQAGFAAGDPAFDPFQAFDANEKSYAAYLQAHYQFEGAIPVDGVIGLRAVRTEVSLDGTVRQFENGADPTFSPITSENGYVDFLPSLSARARLTDELQLRLSATKTRTRPTFAQLNPAISIDPNINPSTGTYFAFGGNVNLEPLESNNFDVSLEYYFDRTSSATIALFHRDFSGFIVNQRRNTIAPDGRPISLDQPINLNERTISGAEASFTTFFDWAFVPDWARGFGVAANYTYLDADADLPGLSETSYNVTGIYERGPFSARLSYNTRSEWLAFPCEGGTGNPGCEYVKDVSRLDFSASYTPIENVTIAFDATNLLGEPFQSYRNFFPGDQGPESGIFPRDVRFEETIYSLGLRFRY